MHAHRLPHLLTFALITIAFVPSSSLGDNPSSQSFDKNVAPIFATHCLGCHSGARPKGGLSLTTEQAALKGGRKGKAIVPGMIAKSLLWKRVVEDEMPPEHPLKDADKVILKKWISDGAKWGTDPIDPFRYTTARRAGYDWWSLQPIQQPAMPTSSEWTRNGIDLFVLQKLKAHQLTPSPQASPRTLMRRLYYDLIGLPPTPEVVEAFERDPSEEAYLKLVDNLLASPQYGERWGRHWLDVARFGESDGFERNNPRKSFWHYRDWVIRSLNADLPYDQFAKMQLIGDLQSPDLEGASAVGFLVAGVHNTVVGGSERMKRIARQDELEEIVSAVGQTFLGLTVNCARCHDHKFDPIRTEEYYRMIAALDGINHGERTVSGASSADEIKTLTTSIEKDHNALNQIDAEARKAILAKRKKQKNPTKADTPRPIASWDFENDLKDSIGNLHGKAMNGAKIENGALVVDGRGFVQTPPLEKDLGAKTLEAWVMLDDLNQRGGGVVSVQTLNGATFDAIVYGERQAKSWMAGSDFFRRSQTFGGPAEREAKTKPVHVAITWASEGTITRYRNGVIYDKAYRTGHQRFEKGKAQIVFGMRHGPPGSNKMLRGKILRANLYDNALSPDAVAASAGVESNYVSEKAIEQWLTPNKREARRQIKTRLAITEGRLQQLRSVAKTKVYTVLARNPGVMKVHVRGSVTDFGPSVSAGGVASVRGVNANFKLAPNAPDAQRRRELAEWITAKSNPLFSRVIVNRIWHYHFGRGIVDTPNDFGFNGGRPSHPELLDWLALQLQKNDFRLKPMHRLIVTSATYRQASRPRAEAKNKDANNRWLWRYSPRRIEAEVLRDTMLSLAGVLNDKQGGPGFEDVTITPNNGTVYYEPVDRDTPEHHRRTVYRFTPRGERSAVLDTFDCPDPSTKAPKRPVTTTPLQALSLLNNAFVLRMSDRFAERVKRESGKDVEMQVRRVWRIALGRSPDAEEIQLAVALVKRRGLSALCRALFNANELIVIE